MESPSILGAALTMIIGHLLKKNNLDQLASLACAIRGTNHTQGTPPYPRLVTAQIHPGKLSSHAAIPPP